MERIMFETMYSYNLDALTKFLQMPMTATTLIYFKSLGDNLKSEKSDKFEVEDLQRGLDTLIDLGITLSTGKIDAWWELIYIIVNKATISILSHLINSDSTLN